MSPNGTISGRHLDEFLANPTLNETQFVTSNCIVNSIEVDGSIYVQHTLDGIALDEILSDVVYKHEPISIVSAFKTFKTLSAPNIRLTSNLINGITFDDFVTSDTVQHFKVNKIYGNVIFNELFLEGLFDYINVTELDQNSIKLFGEQYTEAELIFERDNQAISIEVNELEIRERLNDESVDNFIGLDENVEINEDIILASIKSNECILNGEIIGGHDLARVNGYPIKVIENAHFSRKQPQQIIEPFHVRTAILRGKFDANHFNGYDFQEALDILMRRKTNEQLLAENIVEVNEMYVNGSVSFHSVNNHNFDNIITNAIWLNRSNNVTVPLTFSGQSKIYGNLTVDYLNRINFNTFANDLVPKSRKNPIISGTTVFRSNLLVTNKVDATSVNGYSVGNVLTKMYDKSIENPLNIFGEVTIANINVDGTLNGISGKRISSNYYFNETTQEHIFTGNVLFNNSVHIENLQLNEGFNNVVNVNNHLQSLVRKDLPNVISGTKTFTHDLRIDNNIELQQYNDIDMQAFLNDIILIDQATPIDVQCVVEFSNEVTLKRMNVNGALKLLTVLNRSVSEMYNNAIRTDQPFVFNQTVIFDDKAIEVENIELDFLNDQLVKNIVTLRTEQMFDTDITLDTVVASIPMFIPSGLVNGFNVVTERENTLMVNFVNKSFIK